MITYSGYTIRGQVKKIMSRTEFHAVCIHQLLPGNIQLLELSMSISMSGEMVLFF